jgi:hypothetical protein
MIRVDDEHQAEIARIAAALSLDGYGGTITEEDRTILISVPNASVELDFLAELDHSGITYGTEK